MNSVYIVQIILDLHFLQLRGIKFSKLHIIIDVILSEIFSEFK